MLKTDKQTDEMTVGLVYMIYTEWSEWPKLKLRYCTILFIFYL